MTNDELKHRRSTIGLLVLTAIWMWTAIVDGPLYVRLAFSGVRVNGTIVECTNTGESCTVKLPTGETSGLRNGFFTRYKSGATVDIRWLPGNPATMRGENQLARTIFLRLFAMFVLAGLWLRLARDAALLEAKKQQIAAATK